MSTRRGPGRPPGAPAARREQLIAVTIELVGDQGYPAATLGRIAEAAGLSKASVLHHVPSVAELLAAAYEQVLASLVAEVGAAVEDASATHRPGAYVIAMIGYFREHPRHTRVASEALVHLGRPGESRERWEPLARLLEQARTARRLPPAEDLRTAALAIGGAIDGILQEQQIDPSYDSARAAELLAGALETTVLSPLGPRPR
ncbi:MAG: TetR/AcrR family transcriptional regulator [Brachybacterium sp.]|uniref:TetR/AcrR family transcriptional regulator n=1 Tax=Brachybacterium sp. TaxID=1891286 RepID=UPI0026474A39|nr:TetR/AcrR family transcriptional regulator [Brachybacterium sp.]MDN5687566.1 TetR/AcrR family transcriptional regulator [Brachybacterium sp.]